jgi:hypothetical protein
MPPPEGQLNLVTWVGALVGLMFVGWPAWTLTLSSRAQSKGSRLEELPGDPFGEGGRIVLAPVVRVDLEHRDDPQSIQRRPVRRDPLFEVHVHDWLCERCGEGPCLADPAGLE